MMPHLFFRKPTTMPQMAPASMEPIKHRGMSTTGGRFGSRMPMQAAAIAPTTNCPSAPMLKIPVRKEKATERPVMI